MRMALAFAWMLIAFADPAAGASLEWTLVARRGSAAPPVPTAHDLDWVANVTLRDDGTVFFYGEGPDASLPALYRWNAASGLSLLARLDLPGGPIGAPAVDVEAGSLAISSGNSGRVLVDRRVAITACPDFLFRPEATFEVDDAGNLSPIVSPGAPVAGLDPGWIFGWGQGSQFQLERDPYYDAFTPLVAANDGLAFFAAIVSTDVCEQDPFAPYAHALFGPDGSGGATLVALPEQQAPGVPDAAWMTPTSVAVPNDAGEIAFGADLRLGPTGPHASAIYRWDATHGTRLVARQYAADPDGETFAGPARFALGGAGHIVFDDYSDFISFHGLYVQTPEHEIRTVVKSGDILPGFSEDRPVTYGGPFVVNALGDVAFAVSVRGPNSLSSQQTVWGPNSAGETVLRVLAQQPAPSLSGLSIGDAYPIALSDQRKLLIGATVSGPGVVHDKNAIVYYLIDVDGTFHLLARDGDLHDLGSGVPEVVHLAYGNFVADRALRHFVLSDRFDGSRLLILYATAAPEADSVIATSVAFATLLVLRRRR